MLRVKTIKIPFFLWEWIFLAFHSISLRMWEENFLRRNDYQQGEKRTIKGDEIFTSFEFLLLDDWKYFLWEIDDSCFSAFR